MNLIPYNPTGMYDGSSRDGIARFKNVLDRARLPSTVRLTRGRDIAAACGQLAAAPRSSVALQDAERVAVRVDDPGSPRKAEVGDPVDRR